MTAPSKMAGDRDPRAAANLRCGSSLPVLDAELSAELLAEIRDHLATIDKALRNGPLSREAADIAFRGFHSIKSLAGFLGLHSVTLLAHEAESTLNDGGAVEILLRLCSRMGRLIPPGQTPAAGGVPCIGPLFRNIAHLARDLGVQSGKAVIVKVTGENLQLDRTLLEQLTEPLLHIIRNAVSHGIEIPHVRASRGKPASGTIRLAAAQVPGAVVIEVADDGAGVSSDVLARIFEPRFSTAATVSTISGRGVGMNLVGRRIRQLGGSVRVGSVEGTGTTVSLVIPTAEDHAPLSPSEPA